MNTRAYQADAYRVYIFSDAANSFLLSMIYTAMLVYYIQNVGMNPLQLVLMGTALEATAFVLETPTGIVADTYSRRLSVIIGTVLLGISCLVMGLLPLFGVCLLMNIVSGAGFTFISGAQQAWITDEIGEEAAGRAFLRSSQFSRVSGVIGTLLSMLLGSIALSLPIVLGGALYIALALVLALVMPERGFKPEPRGDRSAFQGMSSTFREGLRVVRGSRILLTIMGIAVVFGAFTEGFDRLNQIHFIQDIGLPNNIPAVVWFGLLNVIFMPVHLIAAEFVRRRVNTNDHDTVARTLMILDGLLIVFAVLFALTHSIVIAVIASAAIGTLRGLNGPIYAAWLNQNVESRVRATVFSMNSQADALGQVAGGPLLGAVGNITLRGALLVSALLLSPVLLLFRRTLGDSVVVQAAIEVAEESVA